MNYPKIGIRPIIDGRRFGVRESLEEQLSLIHIWTGREWRHRTFLTEWRPPLGVCV